MADGHGPEFMHTGFHGCGGNERLFPRSVWLLDAAHSNGDSIRPGLGL